MNVKFEIQQKRDRFRILKFEKGVFKKNKTVLGDGHFYPAGLSMSFHPFIFDSYEEAEDFIFQEYGWNGWRSIQEPKWKTV